MPLHLPKEVTVIALTRSHSHNYTELAMSQQLEMEDHAALSALVCLRLVIAVEMNAVEAQMQCLCTSLDKSMPLSSWRGESLQEF